MRVRMLAYGPDTATLSIPARAASRVSADTGAASSVTPRSAARSRMSTRDGHRDRGRVDHQARCRTTCARGDRAALIITSSKSFDPGDHRDHDVPVGEIDRVFDDTRAALNERHGLRARAVVDGEITTAFQQPRCKDLAHPPDPDPAEGLGIWMRRRVMSSPLSGGIAGVVAQTIA